MSYDDLRQTRDTVRAIEAEYATLRRSSRTPSQVMRHLWLLLDLLRDTVTDLDRTRAELGRTRAAIAIFGLPDGSSPDQLREVLPDGFELVRVHPAKENRL